MGIDDSERKAHSLICVRIWHILSFIWFRCCGGEYETSNKMKYEMMLNESKWSGTKCATSTLFCIKSAKSLFTSSHICNWKREEKQQYLVEATAAAHFISQFHYNSSIHVNDTPRHTMNATVIAYSSMQSWIVCKQIRICIEMDQRRSFIFLLSLLPPPSTSS